MLCRTLGYDLHFGPNLRIASSHIRQSTGRVAIMGDLNSILPGHLVVSPCRPVKRCSEASSEERHSFWRSVRRALELALECDPDITSFNISLKDGPSVEPVVEQIHAHVVPRRPRDLEDDEIHELIERWSPVELEQHIPVVPFEPIPDCKRVPRDLGTMADEAAEYRTCLCQDTLTHEVVQFGPIDLDPGQLFYESTDGFVLGVVNLKPLVQDHVLLIPRRVVPRLTDLSLEEYDSLWESVYLVQQAIEDLRGAGGSCIAVQDGLDANQSVPHVHVHILPKVN